MRDIFTIGDARKMTKRDLEIMMSVCRMDLESMGMEHIDACRFLSEVMNLGIAIQEKINAEKTE